METAEKEKKDREKSTVDKLFDFDTDKGIEDAREKLRELRDQFVSLAGVTEQKKNNDSSNEQSGQLCQIFPELLGTSH